MYYDWTQSHPAQKNHEGRATRHEADLRVVLSLPFESWQLVWSLRSINISATGTLCGLKVFDDQTAQRAHELNALLDAEPQVHVQIDSGVDAIYAPALGAIVVRKEKRPWGLELALKFTEDSEELGLLLGSLETAQRPGKTTWN